MSRDKIRAEREAFVGVTAALAAAISLLESSPEAKKAAASDRMFDQMLADYRRALKAARKVLRGARGGHVRPAGLDDRDLIVGMIND
jgi:hypothetical protein